KIVGNGAEIRPVTGLPSIRDADMSVRISGHSATINIGRGNIETSAGRKLAITNGVFEVPDTSVDAPPARVRFRLDGPVPAAAELDYRKPRGDADAEVRVTTTLDDNARGKLGFDVGAYMSGPVPVKINGRVPAIEGDSRYAVEADLTQARVDKLLPGWTKPPGQPARAAFTLVSKPQLTRFDDLVIESANTSVKGTVEIDDSGEVISANLPIFQLSDGDKAMLKAERGPDGALRVLMRGEVYDGRGFVKSAMAGPSTDQARQHTRD